MNSSLNILLQIDLLQGRFKHLSSNTVPVTSPQKRRSIGKSIPLEEVLDVYVGFLGYIRGKITTAYQVPGGAGRSRVGSCWNRSERFWFDSSCCSLLWWLEGIIGCSDTEICTYAHVAMTINEAVWRVPKVELGKSEAVGELFTENVAVISICNLVKLVACYLLAPVIFVRSISIHTGAWELRTTSCRKCKGDTCEKRCDQSSGKHVVLEDGRYNAL